MNYFITGIGTNVGKTVVSAVFTEALKADYWKPVQSGTIAGLDSETLRSLISNTQTIIHPESYLLKQPLSPHYAARLDGIEIKLENINLPSSRNKNIVIEGAGGLLVPLNKTQYVIDIAKQFNCDVVLVISSYLGCINHSLLSVKYLLSSNMKLHMLVFNGTFDDDVKQAIIQSAPPECKIISLQTMDSVSKKTVSKAAGTIQF